MHTLRGLGLAAVLAATMSAQQPPPAAFPPGFVDPAPILAAAAKEIGEASLQCVTFSGTGYAGAVGQAFEYVVPAGIASAAARRSIALYEPRRRLPAMPMIMANYFGCLLGSSAGLT